MQNFLKKVVKIAAASGAPPSNPCWPLAIGGSALQILALQFSPVISAISRVHF